MASSDVVSWVLGHSPADWLSQTELATLPESSEISGEPGTPSWWDDDESQEGESFLSRLGRDFVHCLDWVSGFEFLQDRLGVVLSLGILLSLEESFSPICFLILIWMDLLLPCLIGFVWFTVWFHSLLHWTTTLWRTCFCRVIWILREISRFPFSVFCRHRLPCFWFFSLWFLLRRFREHNLYQRLLPENKDATGRCHDWVISQVFSFF